MSESDWTDLVVGERMQVDKKFNEKVAASHFSSQQWNLVMTAVEFEVENADDPEQARIVPDTSKVETILPELERVEQRRSMAGAGGPGDAGGSSGSGGSGLFDSIKDALGLGGSGGIDREQLAAAEEMTQMYADDLQEKLEAKGKWDTVREAASDG
ncbi:hypothetical protein BRC60_11630 [Halobacteriales archaeon QH_1_68_42]|nr:MAG: hypothetical protein BRC60_11630 [Halobacteriales archaeon QH_1_68_42]